MANEQNLETVCKSIFGISSRQYRNLANDGKVPPVVSGKIDFPLATKQLLEYYRKLAAGQGSLSLTDERIRLTKINADRKDLQLNKERGDLLHVDTAMKLWGAVCQNIRGKMLAIPKKLAPLIFGARTIPEIEATTRKAIHECLEEVSEPDFKRMAGDSTNTKNAKAAQKPASKPVGGRRKGVKSRKQR